MRACRYVRAGGRACRWVGGRECVGAWVRAYVGACVGACVVACVDACVGAWMRACGRACVGAWVCACVRACGWACGRHAYTSLSEAHASGLLEKAVS